MEPAELAAQLGVDPKSLRAWLRRTYPRSAVDHSTHWFLDEAQVAAARARFSGAGAGQREPASSAKSMAPGRRHRDEHYVIDPCDEVLGEAGRRQHRFDWLLGDPGTAGGRVQLPVDAYYPGRGLVVEYRERQHDEPVEHFDTPDRMTVSGVHRGEQRRIYDERRAEMIPAHGLRLVIVRPADLASDARGRLLRDRSGDIERLRPLLEA